MNIRFAALALASVLFLPSIARADMTAFLGRNSADDDGSIARGFAFGASLLVIGFEFEYATTSEDVSEARPSFRTISGNAVFQTFGLPGFQLYFTTGVGNYRERLASDETSGFLLNNGGGVKINLAGPLRARVDYRIFNVQSGEPRHTTVHRLYGGINLAF